MPQRQKNARQTGPANAVLPDCLHSNRPPRKTSRNVRSPAHNEFAVEQPDCSTANSIRTSVAIPYGTSIDFLAVVFALVRCHFDLQGDHADRRHSGLIALVAVLAPARSIACCRFSVVSTPKATGMFDDSISWVTPCVTP